jgi:ATP-dependent DNA helicase RecG
MDKQKLISLLNQEEGPKLDFKEILELSLESGKKELTKDAIAIANSHGGRGYLLIGIKDKTKEIIGVDKSLYKEETIQQIIGLRCDPPLTIRVEPVEIASRTVVVITIFRSSNKPHQMRQTGAFYLRRGSTTDYATRDEVAGMLQYNGVISNERIPVLNMGIDVFDSQMLEAYLERIGLGGESSNLPLLSNLGILHYDRDGAQYFPTVGAVLMFTKTPQLYLPHTGIRIVDKLGDRTSVKYLKGDVFKLIDEANEYFARINELYGYDYPVSSLEECVINAIIHRDYFDTGRDIFVDLTRSKVIVSNPGSIFGGENVDAITRDDNPRKRNIWLYMIFITMDDSKRLIGRLNGFKFIKDCFRQTDRVRFINIRRNNLFKVVLPGYEIFRRGEDSE